MVHCKKIFRKDTEFHGNSGCRRNSVYLQKTIQPYFSKYGIPYIYIYRNMRHISVIITIYIIIIRLYISIYKVIASMRKLNTLHLIL